MKTATSSTAAVTGARLAPRATPLLLALGIHIFGFTRIATAAPGDLDPSFGTAVLPEEMRGSALTRQSDGKIVVVGGGVGGVWTIARYTTSGVLDPTFSDDGWTTTDFGISGEDSATAVAIQSDGKIVVGGRAMNPTWSDFAVVRFNPDGTLDTSFSGDGRVVTQLNTRSDENDDLSSLLIQPDGKIIAVGRTDYGGQMAAVRYTSNGSLDTSFASNSSYVALALLCYLGVISSGQRGGRVARVLVLRRT